MNTSICRRALLVLPWIAAGSWPSLASAEPQLLPESSPSAELLAERIDRVYGTMKTLKATFRQVYPHGAAVVGSVVCEKPGKMSWRYRNNGNRIVSDGDVIRTYEPRAAQMYELARTQSQVPAAVAFFGEAGELQRSFHLSSLGAAQDWYLLAARPRVATRAYERIILYVDRATYQVRRVLIRDAQGNRARLDFTHIQPNARIAAGEFVLTPPTGTRVFRL